MLNPKTIIWQFFGWDVHYPLFLLTTEVSDVSANVRVHRQGVKTELMKIHVSLGRRNFATMLRRVWKVFVLLIALQTGWPLEKAAPWFTFPKKGSYRSQRISLILLPTIAQCLIDLSISASLRSQKAFRIWINLIMAIVLHCQKPLLCPLPDLQLSLFVKFDP